MEEEGTRGAGDSKLSLPRELAEAVAKTSRKLFKKLDLEGIL